MIAISHKDGKVGVVHQNPDVTVNGNGIVTETVDIESEDWPDPSPVDDNQVTEEYKSHYYDPDTGEISIKYERTDDETGKTSIREEVVMTV